MFFKSLKVFDTMAFACKEFLHYTYSLEVQYWYIDSNDIVDEQYVALWMSFGSVFLKVLLTNRKLWVKLTYLLLK